MAGFAIPDEEATAASRGGREEGGRAVRTHEIRIDGNRRLADEPETGHNRWHPGIPPVIRVDAGDEVLLETRDSVDGQIGPGATLEDVLKLDPSVIHPLTGPVYVEGAEPGDLLEVEILEVTAGSFGFTLQSPGFGFLRDDFPDPFVVHWRLEDGWATSDDIPGVRIPGAPFMGTIGVAPSKELLQAASDRERQLAGEGGMVDLPDVAGAVPADPSIAAEALRTIPPRENAGNVDIKQLVEGTRLLIPVWVPGALFSAGDAHFAQGDCETCGQAIEMRATLRARFGLRKDAAAARGVRDLQFERNAPSGRPECPYFATTGVCVERSGRNAMEDLTLAARNALRNMIDHLTSEGYTRQQAYAICSVAVDLKVSQVVDVPNVLVSAFLPLDIFESRRA
jgi:formamidase